MPSEPTMRRCLIVEDSPLTRVVLEGYVAKHPELELAGSVASIAEGAEHLNGGGIHLVLLDVELEDGSGVDLARRLGRHVQSIFVTSNEAYATDAFHHRAADFLLKPVGYRRFVEAVERARRLGMDGPAGV